MMGDVRFRKEKYLRKENIIVGTVRIYPNEGGKIL